MTYIIIKLNIIKNIFLFIIKFYYENKKAIMLHFENQKSLTN